MADSTVHNAARPQMALGWSDHLAAGFHDLRRLNVTSLVVGGVDVKTAQVRLGHADPRMTLAIYASAPASADREAADFFAATFFGSKSE